MLRWLLVWYEINSIDCLRRALLWTQSPCSQSRVEGINSLVCEEPPVMQRSKAWGKIQDRAYILSKKLSKKVYSMSIQTFWKLAHSMNSMFQPWDNEGFLLLCWLWPNSYEAILQLLYIRMQRETLPVLKELNGGLWAWDTIQEVHSFCRVLKNWHY